MRSWEDRQVRASECERKRSKRKRISNTNNKSNNNTKNDIFTLFLRLKRENSTLLMEIARLKRRTSEMARAERTSGGDTQLGFALAVNESDETKENALNLSFQTF